MTDGLPFEELEQVYEALAQAVERVGAEQESLLLAKLCLTLASQLDDRTVFDRSLAIALEDL